MVLSMAAYPELQSRQARFPGLLTGNGISVVGIVQATY